MLSFLSITTLQGQQDEYQELVKLYKENYIEWITSKEIEKLQKDNPDIKKLIESIPIQQTKIYQQEWDKIKRGEDLVLDMDMILNEDVVDSGISLIKKMLAPENTEIISRLYWRVIESSETKDIADIIVRYMEKAKDDVILGSEKAIKTIK